MGWNHIPSKICTAMFRSRMPRPLQHVLLAALLWVLAGTAQAEKADRNQPMNVEADALRYDDAKQISVFSGNVVITKGTLILRAARVEVRQDAQGYQQGVATAAPGQLAYFKQKRDGLDEFMEGEAQSIEYNGRADTVKFVGRAVLRRLRGATMVDETSGALITYDNTTDTFSVDGGSQNATPANPGGRVRAIIGPRAAASSPAPAASGPATNLRSSTSLGGEKK
jgi:lipopolysaccharide export system protein LptA